MKNDFFYKYIVKNIDVGLVGIYTLLVGIALCLMLELLFPKYNDEYEKNTPLYQVVLEIFVTTALMICCAKYIRELVVEIPFYYDSDPAYKPYQYVKARGNILLAFSLISFNPSYRKKIEHVLKKSGVL